MPEFEIVAIGDNAFRGFSHADEEARLKFKRYMESREGGELVKLAYSEPRNPGFHRKFFAMVNHAFDHWDPARGRKRLTFKGKPIEKNFERFRKDMVIRAGFYAPSYEVGRNGKTIVRLEAESLAFGSMTQERFTEVYEAVFKVLLEDVMVNYSADDFREVLPQLESFG